MKTKATLYNSITNLCLYFVTILVGIVNRQAIIQILGIEYQGINSLFSNVLSMLSIAELGIGAAIVYHLYQPLEEGDVETLKALMLFYRKCYYVIAAVVLSIGIVFIPFLHFFITENPTQYSISFIYCFFLVDVVISYLFTFKRSILIADQKNYIITLCDIVFQLAVKIGQAIILLLSKSFVGYLIFMVLCRMAENLAINIIANRTYGFLNSKVACPLSKEILTDIRKKVSGAFFHKIGNFVVLGTDNLLISRFLGLATVGVYSNYYLVINSIQSICSKTLTAATASVGHMLTEKNEQKSQQIFNQLLILNGFLVTVGASGIYCIATPFISLTFGDEYTVSQFTLFILSLNMYLQGTRTVYSVFKEAAGILYEDRFIPLLESFINIVSSVLFVKWCGLAGIFLGTIVSTMILYTYTFPVLVAKRLLNISLKRYWKNFFWMLATVLLTLCLTKRICLKCNTILPATLSPFGVIVIDCLLVSFLSATLYLGFFAYWQKGYFELLERFKKYRKKN